MTSWFNDRVGSTEFPWFGYASLLSAANTASPTFVQQRFTEIPMNYGQICNSGIACTTGGDRTMADFFGFSLDPDTGAMRIVYNNTTSQHHGAHLYETKQIAGPTAFGTTLSGSAPTNPVSDPTGDAQDPHYSPGGTGANAPQYDFTNVQLSRPNVATLRVQMTLNSLASLAPPAGETNGVWLTRFQALSVGEGGEEAYRIFYVGAESAGGGAPTFFAGSGTAASTSGAPGNGCVTRNPQECKIVLYPAEASATGSVVGNVITINVPLQGGFGGDRPIKGDTLYNVTGLTFGRSEPPASPQAADFLYKDLDATRAFDFSLVTTQPGANLIVDKIGPASAKRGQNMTYQILVKNNGPDTANTVTVTDNLPKNAGYGAFTTTKGTCTLKPAKRLLTCALGNLANQQTVTITITVKPTDQNPVTNTVSVKAASPPDPDPTNNQDSVTTTVT
jgi:uncharacterized repeat protein (TIGR01451 family)